MKTDVQNLQETIWRPERPDLESKLWRYMSLPKYLDLLRTGELFFCRADLLEDPFEGARGMVKGDSAYESPSSIWGRTASREKYYISCWHLYEYEQAMMWKMYANGEGSVAIRSTFGALVKALPNLETVGLVSYQRYRKDDPGELRTEMEYYFLKRRYFEAEREVRAVIFRDAGRKQTGLRMKIDLNDLVERVYVVPRTPKWLRDTLTGVTRQYGLQRNVEPSPNDRSASF